MLGNFRWWLANRIFDIDLVITSTRVLATLEENDRVVGILRQNLRKTITEKLITEQIEVEVQKVILDNLD